MEVRTSTFIEGQYDPEKVPADWKAAERHGNACQPGRTLESQSKRTVCPCCMNEIDKQVIPYSEDVKELSYLGAGFPLFYNYLKFCILMLFAMIADSCALSAYLSTQQNQCASGSNPHCVNGIANSLSYVSSDLETPVRIILSIVSFTVQMFLLILMRQTQNSLTIYYSQRTHRISDFTLKVKHLPIGYQNNKARIQSLIGLKCPHAIVKGVLLISRTTEFDEKLKQLKALKHQRRATEDTTSIKAKILTAHYDQAQLEMAETVNRIELDEANYFIGLAFVTFNTKDDRDEAILGLNSLTEKDILSVYSNAVLDSKKKVKALKAREPSEIIWENIEKPKKERTLALISGWILTIVFIAVITIAFFFMIKARSHFIEVAADGTDQYGRALGVFMGYFTITTIVLINKFLLPPICHLLTDIEKHTNFNEFEFSFALKYTLSMFFTTAIMTLAVQAIVYKNYHQLFGVVEAESYMFILNAFIPPIVWAVNPYYIAAKLKQKKRYGSSTLTQAEANELMELPAYSMGKRYADTVKTMWFTFLYVSIIPIGAAFSMMGMICYFFVDKYVLLRKSSVKNSVSSHLANYMMFLLDLTLFFKPLGEIFFDYNLRNQTRISNFLMIGAAIIYIALPLNKIFQRVMPQKLLKHNYTYDELSDTFLNTYKNSYPLNQSKRTVMLDKILSSQTRSTDHSSKPFSGFSSHLL